MLKGDFSGISNIKSSIYDIGLLGQSIKSVQTAINSISALSSRNVFLGNGAIDVTTVDAYRASIRGLTTEQAALALSSSGLNQTEAMTVLTYKDGAVATEALSAEEAKLIVARAGLASTTQLLSNTELTDLATRQGITTEVLTQSLVESGLIVTKEGDIVTTEELNTKELQSALVKRGVNEANAEQISGILAEIAAKKAATASTTQYVASTDLLRGSLAKLKATMAAHPILTFAAVLGAGVAAIWKYKQSIDKLIDSAKDISGEFESTKKKLSENSGKFEELSERYAELSKGVNALGENVSLSTDEYEEYRDVVQSIADMCPELISGYDAQGTAILNVKGNVEELTAAYEKNIKAANNSYLANTETETIIKARQKAETKFTAKNETSYQIDSLENFLSGKGTTNDLMGSFMRRNAGGFGGYEYSDLTKILRSIGVDPGFTKDDEFYTSEKEAQEFNDKLKNTLEHLTSEQRDLLQGYVSQRNAEYDEIFAGDKQVLKANLENNILNDKDLSELPDAIKTAILNIPESIDTAIYNGLNSATDFKKKAKEITDTFKKLNQKDLDTLNEGINLTTSFNNDEISYEDYISKCQELSTLINTLFPDEEIQTTLKLLFDIPDEEELSKKKDVFANRIGEMKISSNNSNTSKNNSDLVDEINEQLEELEKGGNVNLKLRPEIDTKYLKDVGWKDIEDGIATVYTSTFSNEEGTKYINFTPIIVDPETGEYKGVLSPDELTEYAEGVIAGTKTDDLNLQIGTEFDSVEEAEEAAQKIHNLHERLSTVSNSIYSGSSAGMPSDVREKLNKQGAEIADEWYGSLKKSEREFVDNLSDEDLAEAVKFDSTEQFDEWLDKLQAAADSHKIEVRTNAGAAENLDAMKDAFDDLSTAYFASVKNQDSSGNATNNIASADDIQGVNDAFGGVTEIKSDTALEDINALSNAIEQYDTALIENKGDAEVAQEAADKLATAYVDLSDVLDDLTEENKDYYKEQLKANGITNADEVIESRLSKQYQKTRAALENLSKSVAKNRKNLDAGVDAGEDYENAIKDISSDVKDLISIYDDAGNIDTKLTPDFSEAEMTNFIKDNLEDIEAATEGDIDALVRLKMEVARLNAAKAYVDVNLPSDVVEAQLDNLMDKVAQVDAMDIEVGASVDDTAFIASLQNMIDSGQTTADAVSAAFESMGYTVEFRHKTASVELVEYIEKHGANGMPSYVPQKMKEQISVPELKITRNNSSTGAKVNSYNGGNSSNNSGGSGDGGSNSEETFDWIEVAIDRLENNLDKLGETVDSTYEKWESRNKALKKSIDEVNREIELQEEGAAEYLKKAESINLSEDWKKKVREGKIEIDTVSDDKLKTNIQNYQTFWEKYQDAMDKSKTLTQTIQGYYKQLFDNVSSQYDQLLDNISSKTELIDERISRMEEHGYFVDEQYYKKQQSLEEENQKTLVEERAKLIKNLEDAVSKGTIKKGSESWQEMYQKIQDVNKQIEESKTKMVELNNTILELQWSKFDWIEERMKDINEEATFLQNILSNKNLFSEDVVIKGETKNYSSGKFSNAGMASAALTMARYDEDIAAARRYTAEIEKLDKKLANDPNNTKLIEKKEEYIQAQRESIEAAEQEKQAIKSLIQEAIEKNIEALNKLIEKYNDSLQAAKD